MAVTTNAPSTTAATNNRSVADPTPEQVRMLKEARTHLEKGELYAKPRITSRYPFRWKPKLTAAGDEFCKSAVLFHGMGDVEASKTSLLRACECFKRKRAWYSAAKTLEQAMAITHNQGDLDTMTELAWRSAALFRKAGQPDSAAQLLERASVALEATQPDSSMLLLEKAVETVETENRPIQAASYLSKLVRMSLERDEIEDAIAKTKKLVELYQEANHKPSTGRAVLSLVVLLLKVHRTSEAEIAAREFGNNCSKDQNVLIEDFLDAFDQNDVEKIQAAQKSKLLLVLDPEFKPVVSSLSLHQLTASQGVKQRTRSRRKFSVDEPKKQENDQGEQSSDSSSSDSDDSGKSKKKSKKKGKKEKKAPIADGEDAKLPGDSNAPSKTATPTKIPTNVRGKLMKMKTIGGTSEHKSENRAKANVADLVKLAHKSGDKSPTKPSAYIDVTTDSIDRHRPSNLPAPAVYLDVEGADPLQPAFMGMTVEQWRAFKRSNAADEEDYAFDDGGANDW